MLKTDPIQQMLISLYAAPLRPEMWETFLTQMGATFEITKAALIAHDLPKGEHRILALLGDSVRDSLELYERQYSHHDEWTKRFPRFKNKLRHSVVQGEEAFPEALLVRTKWYNEFLRPFDVHQIAVLGAWSDAGRIDALSAYRSPREDKFDNQLLAGLEFLVPHIQTALFTRRQLLDLKSQINDLSAALDTLPQGIALCDKSGQCIILNSSARRLIERSDGLFMSRGVLTAGSVSEADEVHAMIASFAAPNLSTLQGPRAARVLRRTGRPLHLVAAPFRPESVPSATQASVVVFINDPDDVPVPPLEILRSLYGLTMAEARLAMALAKGRSLAEAANLHSVVEATARKQLKSVMQKTGVCRQAELMRLITTMTIPSDGR